VRRSVKPAVIFLSSGLLGAGVTAFDASGQVVRGRLLDSDGATGIGGAMISLVDGRAAQEARSLTRPSGLYQLAATAPGRYRIRADRIGYATTYSDFFDLSVTDTLMVDIVARIEAVSLAGIEAEAESRCRVRPADGLAVTRVWDEARKALEAADWTQERGYYQYEMQRVNRHMDRDNRRVISEERSYDRGYRQTPYVSRPAEELMEEGFARLRPTESVYWAPDAAVLLSDPFLDTHCFRLHRDESRAPGLLGLAFRPVPGRRLPDISGTLWLNPGTSQLKWLDFYYENLNLPDVLQSASIGGRVEFQELPNGTWIVDSWRIRMPRVRVATNPLTSRVESVLEGLTVQGGDVLRVHGNEGTVMEAEEGGRIAGVVFDTLRAGLRGARVFAEGTDVEVLTDRNGRFELARLEPGIYTVNYSHPYLERYSFVPEPFEVEVREGVRAPSQINFAAPTISRILGNLCRDEERPDDTANIPGAGAMRNDGILVGQVIDPAGAPLPGVIVRVLSRDFDISQDVSTVVSTTLRAGRSGVAVTTNESGYYRACWVPVDTYLSVSVMEPGENLDPNQLQVGYTLSELSRIRGETVIIPADVPFETLNLRVESN